MDTNMLSRRDAARLKQMNQHLYPAHLSWRADRGTFRFEYRRDGHAIRQTLGDEMETAYERAVLLRKSLDGQAAEGVPVVSQRNVTLGEWYDLWSTEHYPKVSPATAADYLNSWKHLGSVLGSHEISKLSETDILSALDPIMSPSTREHAGVFLSVILKAAVKAGVLSKSPWASGYKHHKRNVKVMSPEQLKLIFAAAAPSARPALMLAGFCGLRRGEIMGLRVGDVDLESGLLRIERSRVRVAGVGIVDRETTKTGEPRVVPIPDNVKDELRPLLVGRKPSESLLGAMREDLPARLRAACRRVGIETEMTLHDLRHVCGSNLMMTGGLPLAQAVLGHKNVGTTVDTYGHLTAAYLSKQVQAAAGESDPKSRRAAELAVALLSSEDPFVRELAGLVMQIWPHLAPGNKKGLTI